MCQLSFADIQISQTRKASRIAKKLDQINEMVDWDAVMKVVKKVDKTDPKTGGAPHRNLLTKVKMLDVINSRM